MEPSHAVRLLARMGLFDRMKKKEAGNVVGTGIATDPVCKMQVDTRAPPGGMSVHGPQTFYFCSPGCKTQFDQDPHRYLGVHSH